MVQLIFRMSLSFSGTLEYAPLNFLPCRRLWSRLGSTMSAGLYLLEARSISIIWKGMKRL